MEYGGIGNVELGQGEEGEEEEEEGELHNVN